MKQVIKFSAQKEEWEKAKEKAFNKLNAKSKIDGFRPGKAPRNVFEKNYPGQIVMEAADNLVDKEYKRIITEDKILPIIEPKIEMFYIDPDIKDEIIERRKIILSKNIKEIPGLITESELNELTNKYKIKSYTRTKKKILK